MVTRASIKLYQHSRGSLHRPESDDDGLSKTMKPVVLVVQEGFDIRMSLALVVSVGLHNALAYL